MSTNEIEKPHSAEYFGDSRDFWWNADFLELMAKRWRLDEVREVLDVGCGVGHWGRAIAQHLPGGARVTGLDREAAWVEDASVRARKAGLDIEFMYTRGAVESLPFADASFDLVTCQTVLIHVADVDRALAEMARVTKPGGLVAVVEPNNVASSLAMDSLSFVAPVDEVIAMARFQLICERGKESLGLGNNSVGEQVPASIARAGLADVRVYMSDKASMMLPPYGSPEQQSLVSESASWAKRDFWIWSREETRRYYIAGGGEASGFDALYEAAMAQRRAAGEAIARGEYACAGGGFSYLVSGRRVC